jgi:hypothetical protein
VISRAKLLNAVPPALRDPLFAEFNSIVQNYIEGRFSPSELSGGVYCEIVYTILAGFASGTYPPRPTKPRDFVSACRALESNVSGPRSFQILLPRLLPALYEIRSNRGVGHTGGDVDPNLMDATAVVTIAKWILAELIRVFHTVSPHEAQRIVDSVAEITVPLVWSDGDIKRVLDTSLKLGQRILALLASCPSGARIDALRGWVEPDDESYFRRALRKLHTDRFVELNEQGNQVRLLPPGAKSVARLLRPSLLK